MAEFSCSGSCFDGLATAHRSHEPPLTRPSATLSPSDGEREGVTGRFTGRIMRGLELCEQGSFHRIFSRLPSTLIEISFAPGGIGVVMFLPPGQRTHAFVGVCGVLIT